MKVVVVDCRILYLHAPWLQFINIARSVDEQPYRCKSQAQLKNIAFMKRSRTLDSTSISNKLYRGYTKSPSDL